MAPLERTSPAETSNPQAVVPASDAAALAERAYALIAWPPVDDIVASETGCLAGDALECLRLADDEDARSRSATEGATKARAYRERAYSMLVLRCKRRDPDACVAIARMHALGFDILRDPRSRQALVVRARDLCKHREAKVCAAFAP